MKNRILIITLLLVSTIISSCSSDDDFNYQSDFENSFNTWLNFKESTNNTYKYTVGSGTWAGSYKETTISVTNGVVTQRYFKYTATDGLSENTPEEELEWTENENEIGTHQNGAEPITIDQIYEKAKQDWLIKRKNVQTYFETENNGIISSCGYRDKNCVDDCFIGVNIKKIESL